MSFGGYIAGPDDDLSFFHIVLTQNLKLISTEQFETGLVQLKYQQIN